MRFKAENTQGRGLWGSFYKACGCLPGTPWPLNKYNCEIVLTIFEIYVSVFMRFFVREARNCRFLPKARDGATKNLWHRQTLMGFRHGSRNHHKPRLVIARRILGKHLGNFQTFPLTFLWAMGPRNWRRTTGTENG